MIISQIQVIDRKRLVEKITAVDGAIIAKVEDSIMLILGIKKILSRELNSIKRRFQI